MNGSVGNIYENGALYSINYSHSLQVSSARVLVAIKFHAVELSLPG